MMIAVTTIEPLTSPYISMHFLVMDIIEMLCTRLPGCAAFPNFHIELRTLEFLKTTTTKCMFQIGD